MVCEDTLRIKNLPKELSNSEKEEFLRHFGAQKVKIMTSKAKEKCVAFAKFESKEVAKAVLLKLHQLTVLNSRLCVEFAENDISGASSKVNSIVGASADSGEYFQQFLKRLNSWNIYSFHQPPPPHLKYSYPKPNRATVNNIAHVLMSVPKFYTQVLHLMNKMNLPPPFCDVSDETAKYELKRQFAEIRNSSEESELESDGENNDKGKEVVLANRTVRQRKAVKRPKFIKPNVQVLNNKESDKVEDVFDKVHLQTQPKIQLKLSMDLPLQDANTEAQMAADRIKPSTENTQDNINFITKEELENGRLIPEYISTLPVFKGYAPGVPTAKLYIKNIAKTVEVEHLEYIYQRYHETVAGSEDQFDIKLMKEGRMKGQAFITFNTIDAAQRALEETNGYVLQEKPLVVVFAKSAAKKS